MTQTSLEIENFLDKAKNTASFINVEATLTTKKSHIFESKEYPNSSKNQVETVQFRKLIDDTIHSLFNYITCLNETIDVSVNKLKLSDENIDKDLNKIIGGVEIFIETGLEIYNSFSKEKTHEIRQDYKEQIFQLICLLKAILSSYKKKDYFMLCDLLEFELKDSLLQWKVQILSKIKAL